PGRQDGAVVAGRVAAVVSQPVACSFAELANVHQLNALRASPISAPRLAGTSYPDSSRILSNWSRTDSGVRFWWTIPGVTPMNTRATRPPPTVYTSPLTGQSSWAR